MQLGYAHVILLEGLHPLGAAEPCYIPVQSICVFIQLHINGGIDGEGSKLNYGYKGNMSGYMP